MDTEEKLTCRWLNDREPFDTVARNSDLRQKVVNHLSDIPNRVIADLGSGTGNNLFYMLDHLTQPCHLYLVEQHAYLLNECRQRISRRYEVINDEKDCLTIRHRSLLFYIYPVQGNFIDWINQQHTVHLYTCGALLDLLTEKELRHLLSQITAQKAALYSTLNYKNVLFKPESIDDSRCIEKFEQHMTRKLDRGNPLGNKAVSFCQTFINANKNFRIDIAESNWVISSNDTDFISQNLAFYRDGIRTDDRVGSVSADSWYRNKNSLVHAKKLGLHVLHDDIFISGQ